MSPQELTDLSVIIARSDEGGWTNCTAPLLDYFAALAARKRLREFAESFCLLAEGVPESASFMFEILPLIITAHYPPCAGIEVSSWDEARPQWNEDLSDALLRPGRFAEVVESFLSSSSS